MKKKQFIFSLTLITILVVAVIGISYAAFSYIGKGSTVNQITTGTISMNYEESSNVIRITNALPTTDETGKVRLVDGEYFDFSVTTDLSGSAVINWEIAAEDFSDNTFDGSNVKFYLTRLDGDIETPANELLPKVYNEELEENISTGRPSGIMSLLVGSTSTAGEETTNYRLRLYVNETYNPQGDGGGLVFKTRINVYGKVNPDEIPVKPIMRAYTSTATEDYHAEEYRSKVTSITTKNNVIVPNTAIEVTNGKENYWDVSEAGDDSVIAYAEDDGMNGYKITIGGKNGILANSDSSQLFRSFTMLTTIDLNNLDTSNVTNMQSIFAFCSKLSNLNISFFDTSNVTNMQTMFYDCSSLTTLNLNNFDTSNVINMQQIFCKCKFKSLNIDHFNTVKVENMTGMFMECTNLANLNLENFNTSNVTSMWSMFYGCSSLTSLNLNNFNTINMVKMETMFSKCTSLSNLDISSFNTSNVTNMQCMFYSCSSLTNLDLTNLDTSKVTDMLCMFDGCTNLTIIKVSSKWTTANADTTSIFFNCGTDHVTVV